jgi:hypothetical protein
VLCLEVGGFRVISRCLHSTHPTDHIDYIVEEALDDCGGNPTPCETAGSVSVIEVNGDRVDNAGQKGLDYLLERSLMTPHSTEQQGDEVRTIVLQEQTTR